MIARMSVSKIRDYLKNKEEDTIIIEEVIDKLIDNKYLDDDRFTKAFIKDKLNFSASLINIVSATNFLLSLNK
mgnify:CR=1 FL=1